MYVEVYWMVFIVHGRLAQLSTSRCKFSSHPKQANGNRNKGDRYIHRQCGSQM